MLNRNSARIYCDQQAYDAVMHCYDVTLTLQLTARAFADLVQLDVLDKVILEGTSKVTLKSYVDGLRNGLIHALIKERMEFVYVSKGGRVFVLDKNSTRLKAGPTQCKLYTFMTQAERSEAVCGYVWKECVYGVVPFTDMLADPVAR